MGVNAQGAVPSSTTTCAYASVVSSSNYYKVRFLTHSGSLNNLSAKETVLPQKHYQAAFKKFKCTVPK